MILLTGASGFIGSNLLSAKKSVNFKIVSRQINSNDPDYFFIDSLDSTTCWDNAFEDVDVIIHLAASAHKILSDNNGFNEVNNLATLNLARQAADFGVKRFVFVSSIGVNGATSSSPFTTESSSNPINSYTRSKYQAEVGLKKLSEETGLEVVIIRPTLVYGPNAPGNFGRLTKLISKLSFLPFGLTSNRRDFISVQNLIDLLLICARHPDAAGHTFLASDGETVSTKEFSNAIAKGLGRRIYQMPIPVPLMSLVSKLLGKGAMAEQLFGDLEVDSSNVDDILGWKRPYSMEESMSFLKRDMK